ncbi:exosortase F system-associated membrane protein [Psychroflexus sediminis]|uniref:Exosortase F-associated protein n=1 Tax=Psychroflexus sediminis TaxID=470826 RepID=A0A1G7UE20_9FLAO|nr:exosortase F system-associated protein [Psychroflexus sediminis]SDG45723.1 exosortase F-associated protein [Psychroflexus sediminis]
MNKFLKFGLLGLLVIGLALIRHFEHELFSDPLLEFYSSKYSYSEPPEFNTFQVICSTSWRFLLNSILSLALIWIAFPSKKTFLFSLVFYGFTYLVLITTFWFFISDMKAENYLIIFYIRRFLIQPIFVLILLPAFYYQKSIVKEK